jgi:hypothetical protein
MQFIITKQIAVEAETPEEAITKINEGKTIAISVNPRPQSPATSAGGAKAPFPPTPPK